MDTDIKKEIGNKIRQFRTVKGLSRGQMADKLKMSESNYGHIERGEAEIGITRLIEISEVFEITLFDLLPSNNQSFFSITGNCITGNSHQSQSVILLSETQCAHELEKSKLQLELKDKELAMKDREIAYLTELLDMHKNSKSNLTE